jgi:hypothetical protein
VVYKLVPWLYIGLSTHLSIISPASYKNAINQHKPTYIAIINQLYIPFNHVFVLVKSCSPRCSGGRAASQPCALARGLCSAIAGRHALGTRAWRIFVVLYSSLFSTLWLETFGCPLGIVTLPGCHRRLESAPPRNHLDGSYSYQPQAPAASNGHHSSSERHPMHERM